MNGTRGRTNTSKYYGGCGPATRRSIIEGLTTVSKKRIPKCAARRRPHVPIWFGGVSDAAIGVGAKHCDVYALFGEPRAAIAESIARVRDGRRAIRPQSTIQRFVPPDHRGDRISRVGESRCDSCGGQQVRAAATRRTGSGNRAASRRDWRHAATYTTSAFGRRSPAHRPGRATPPHSSAHPNRSPTRSLAITNSGYAACCCAASIRLQTPRNTAAN